MQEELNQFYRNKVWTLVPLPYGKIAKGSKWVFKNKKDEHGIVTKNKARLVAQGYSLEEGINYDETFAPVARIEAIRILFAFATYMNFIVFQMDVKSAFLNGKLKEFYVKQLPAFEISKFPDYVCKLEKALYGLKQAPKAWNKKDELGTVVRNKPRLMDVKSAILNGIIKEEVSVRQPPGFKSSEFPDYVWKLDKALYGLKQAPTAWKCLHLLYMDFFGPVSPMSINNEKYTLVIVDEYSRMVENQNDVKFKQIRTDNGTEFRNSELESFYDEKGIYQNFSSPYTHEQNGVVERKNMTLIEATKTMLNGSDHLGKFDAHADDGYFLGYSFCSKAFRVFNTRRQQIKETYHVTFDEKDDPSRQDQSNCDFSYHIIPRGRSLTELTQENHVLEAIALNEQDNPHTKDVKGPPDLINTKGTQEQNVQDEQINHQLTKETSGNNTKTSEHNTELLVPEAPQSQDTNHASKSSYHVAQDTWSKDQHIKLLNIIDDPGEGMHTRSMAAKLTAASASECLFADFISEIEPKKPPGFESSEFLDYVYKLDKTLYGLKQEPRACSSVKTPMVPLNNLGPDLADKPVNETLHRGIIGSLMYLTATRPNIQFSTCLCARYQASPKKSHLIVVKRIFRKSTSGACQILKGELVCWSAMKQQLVAMSLAETKYVVAAGCCANILWMKSQLSDYDIHYKMIYLKEQTLYKLKVKIYSVNDPSSDLEEEPAPTGETSAHLAPKNAKQLAAKRNQERVKSILLLAIPDEYLLKFHNVADAKSLWKAIKSRLRDINQKFLRSLPPSWNQIALIMRNKPDIDEIDIDDLYNNLRVYEDEMIRSSSSTPNS
ncbi:retrovirus-related pol polyprotein from transposon TNT 1-94 [Tanacetum coccineum]